MSLETLDRAARFAAKYSADFAARHPRSLTATVVVMLAGFAATAFGLAPLAPDAADLPKRLVSEVVVSTALEVQLETLARHGLSLYRGDLTRASDTADSLLRRLNVDDVGAALFLRRDPTARKLLEGRAGKMVQVRTDESGRVEELLARYPAESTQRFSTHFTRLHISRIAGKLLARVEAAPLVAQVRIGSGSIRSSLFAATDEARIPDAIASQMAEMFSTEIDFHRELRKGDSFTVIYEALTADGEPIAWATGNEMTGRVLAAEFTSNGRSHSALWFSDSSAKGGYFGLDGRSKQHAFLASPMVFSRVTSSFSMRMHPIMHTSRAHLGIDYAAPSGTPVRSVGDGVVAFAGWQRGYGNVVQIEHANERASTYAHLSRIDLSKGQRVEQGTSVGAVGATGMATGPHLHFEFKVKGQQQDPIAMAKASEAITIAPAAKAQFAQLAEQTRTQLQAAASTASLAGFSE